MELAKDAIFLAVRGGWDCVCGIKNLLINYLFAQNNELSRENVERISVRDSHYQGNASYNVRNIFFECFAFHLYFLLSDYIFDDFLLQSALIQLVDWAGEDMNSTPVIYLQKVLYFLFCILWILPMLCLSKFLCFNWYQDIANFVLFKSGHKKHEDIKMSEFYADQIKSIVLQMMYCVQAGIIFIVPIPWYVQNAYSIFHFSLLSSLYAFEYKWVYTGWPLHKRLLNIAKKWPYYLGFGFPLALISNYVPTFFRSLIVFAALFPVYVISSSVAQDSKERAFRYQLHTFKLVDFLSDFGLTQVMNFLNLFLGSN